MLLVHIEGFLEVARLNSVSRAAETLYVTQPTLTARLHALERELGERLFVRARHGMRLTDAGRAFMPYAERAVRALREGRRAIEELETGHAGQLQLVADGERQRGELADRALRLDRADRYPRGRCPSTSSGRKARSAAQPSCSLISR